MRRAVPLAVLALLVACKAGPDHAAPRAAQADAFVRAGDAVPTAPLARWWEALGDAQLSALVSDGLENAPQIAVAQEDDMHMRLRREGVEEQVALEPVARDGRGTRRVIHWAGALLQELPRAVTLQRGLAPAGVYISLYWYGSPASRSKLRAARAIVAVDERPTPNLDAFLEVVRGRPDRSSLRIKSIDLEGKARLQTVRLDLEYYPTYELCWDGDGWRRVEHEA